MRRVPLTLTLLLAAHASAAVPGLTLNWSAPPECPGGAQIEAAVVRQLGEPGVRAEPPLTVTALVAPVDGGWQVELTNAQGGTRTLTGTTCLAVASASVVVIALMIDPLAVTDAAPVIEAPAPARPFFVGVWGSGDTSSLPRLSPGLGLTVGVGLVAGFSVEVHGQAWLPQATDRNPGATLTLFTGSLGLRRDFEVGPFFVAPVLAFEAGALRARSFGISNPEVNAGVWLAARGGLALGISWRFLRFGFRFEAVVPVTRPRFIAGGVGELYTPPVISGRGAFSLELRFPPREGGGGSN